MESMLFYPTLTTELIEICGLEIENYLFQYKYNESIYDLSQSGGNLDSLPPYSQEEKVSKLAEKGVITNAEVSELLNTSMNAANVLLCTMARKGLLIRKSRGVYASCNSDSYLEENQMRIEEFFKQNTY